MMELPEPLVPSFVDCTDLDGFLLNVERLMASELVALSSHEVVAAALFLWCRAWKQTPAASLPDDDRVMAAFARLPLARFRKLKNEALRGFVRCSDGRLYHRVLAKEALIAFERKIAFRKRRETDANRLRNWRAKRGETQDETDVETQDETRFVREGKGQGRDREGTGKGQGRDREGNISASQQSRAVDDGSASEPDLSGNRLDAILTACCRALGHQAPADAVIGPIALLIDRGAKLEEILTVLRSEAQRPRRTKIRTWRLWADVIAEQLAGPTTVLKPTENSDDPVVDFGGGYSAPISTISAIVAKGRWMPNWGPSLSEPGCRVPEPYRSELQKLEAEALRAGQVAA